MKRVFNLMIVDESGSMSIIEKQALAGINETIETVGKMQKLYPEMEQRVTLITFDSSHCSYVFNNAPVVATHKLKDNEYNPGGATPLYDAIGQGISRVNAQAQKDDSVLVTIITDGEENCSQEYNLAMVKTLIEKMKTQGWTFALIGTDDLNVEGMAGAMSIDNHMRFEANAEDTMRMFREERCARERYCKCVAEGEQMPSGVYFKKEEKD